MNIKSTLHNTIIIATLITPFISVNAATLNINSAINTDAPDALNQTAESVVDATKKTIDSITQMTKEFLDSQSTTATKLQEGLTKNIYEVSHSDATKIKEQADKDAKEALDKEYAEICKKNLSFGDSCTKDEVDESASAINEYLNTDPNYTPHPDELRSISGVSPQFTKELLEQQQNCKIIKTLKAKETSLDLATLITTTELMDSQDRATNNTNSGSASKHKVISQRKSSLSAQQIASLDNRERKSFEESFKLNYRSINGNISASYSLPGRSSQSTSKILSTDYAYTTPAHYQIAIDFKNNIINREAIPNSPLGTGSVSKRSSFNSKHAALSIAEESLLKMIARRTPPSISHTLSNLNDKKLTFAEKEKELRSDSKSSINGYNNIVKKMSSKNAPNFSSLALRYKNAADFNNRMAKFSTFSDEAKLKEIYNIQSAANQLTLTKIESMERIEMLLAALLASEINYRSQ
jgi:hypothetical protein